MSTSTPKLSVGLLSTIAFVTAIFVFWFTIIQERVPPHYGIVPSELGSVLAPGYKLQIGNRVVSVSGNDSCDRAFTPQGKHNCIDLGTRKTDVTVHYEGVSGEAITENWRIARDGKDSVSFWTPSGEFVSEPRV